MTPRTAAKRAAIGKRLRAIRLELRLNRSQFADRLNVSESAIGMWESGQRVPRNLMEIADSLGVDPYWLAGERKPKIEYANNGSEPR